MPVARSSAFGVPFFIPARPINSSVMMRDGLAETLTLARAGSRVKARSVSIWGKQQDVTQSSSSIGGSEGRVQAPVYWGCGGGGGGGVESESPEGLTSCGGNSALDNWRGDEFVVPSTQAVRGAAASGGSSTATELSSAGWPDHTSHHTKERAGKLQQFFHQTVGASSDATAKPIDFGKAHCLTFGAPAQVSGGVVQMKPASEKGRPLSKKRTILAEAPKLLFTRGS